jgi:hypothetical protein
MSVAATLTGSLNAGSANAVLSNTVSTAVGSALAAGAGLADVGWWDKRTLAASTAETIDFAGTLHDPFGGTINFARLKVLMIAADLGNTNNVVVGAGGTTLTGLFGATTHSTNIRPGGAVLWLTGTTDSTGYPVSSGTTDLLSIANSSSGTSVIYTIVALGVST